MAGKMNFDSDDSDREDDDLEVQSVPCLFCNGIYGSILLAIDHLSKDHHVDLSELQIRFNMDQYSYIKVSSLDQIIAQVFKRVNHFR